MNKLKKYAGLLNEEAPENHFLAYITKDEKDMLIKAGGSGKMTPQGIPSFYVGEGMDFEPASDYSVEDMSGVGENNGGSGDSGGVPDYESGSPQNTLDAMPEEMANRVSELTQAQREAVLGDHGDPLGDPAEQAKYARYIKHTAGNQPLNKTEDLTFKEHWDNAPAIVKWSPTLRLLYAGGKNLGEWARSKGWNWDSTTGKVTDHGGNEVSESDMHGATASQAPHMIGGTTTSTAASTSPSSVWFNNLSSSQSGFNLKSSYANAKAAVSQRLGKPSSVGLLAVNNSSYYNWLKDNSLNKGIL